MWSLPAMSATCPRIRLLIPPGAARDCIALYGESGAPGLKLTHGILAMLATPFHLSEGQRVRTHIETGPAALHGAGKHRSHPLPSVQADRVALRWARVPATTS